MASSLTKINKKLNSLFAAKAKEEERVAEAIKKLTNKYQEDLENLKSNYEAKVKEQKEISASKIALITPEIDFYTKQKNSIEKLEAQLRNLDEATEERLSSKSKTEEYNEQEDTIEG